MEGAGFHSARELLYAAGRIEERHAVETLERHMYGPPTEVRGGYLVGLEKPLDMNFEEQMALANTLVRGVTPEASAPESGAAEHRSCA